MEFFDYIVNSNPSIESGETFDIIDKAGRYVSSVLLCEDHQIRPAIAASENIPEDEVRYTIDAALYEERVS